MNQNFNTVFQKNIINTTIPDHIIDISTLSTSDKEIMDRFKKKILSIKSTSQLIYRKSLVYNYSSK